MGLFNFRRKGLTVSPTVVDASITGQLNTYQKLGGVNQQVNSAWLQTQSASYAYIYQTQPAVRMVIDTIARNVAQLGLKLYERVDDNQRQRDELHPAALTMAEPNEYTPADRFIWQLVADYLVHDNAYILKFRKTRPDGTVIPDAPLTLIPVPPSAIAIEGVGRYEPLGYRFFRYNGSIYPQYGEPPIPPQDIIHWRGYNPADARIGISKLATLRDVLAEESAAQAANVELLKSGLAKPGIIERPVEAPDWSQEAQERFREQWSNQVKDSPRKTPILEEGMKFADLGITPRDAQMLDGRRFTIEEVCRLYGVPLAILGMQPPQGRLDLAESHKEFYADTLAPLVTELACQLDFSILKQEYNDPKYYFEFDLNSKLQGDPQQRFPALTTAAGRPWMTVNEIRAVENLPPVPNGDELTIPLNVSLAGDQGDTSAPQLPAPNVMPPQDANKPPQDGSYRASLSGSEDLRTMLNGNRAMTTTKQYPLDTTPRHYADVARQRRYIDEAKALLERHYARQGRALKSANAKAADTERWNTELATDIEKFLKSLVEREGGIIVARHGGADFDYRQVENYVKAMAAGTAEGINRATQRDIEQTSVAEALDRARGERAQVAGVSIGARATTFARTEGAKQAPNSHQLLKTWIADTDRHAELDGVSVPLDSDWGGIEPGSEPNCACSESVG